MALTINPLDSCSTSLLAIAAALAAYEASPPMPSVTLSTPSVVENTAAGVLIGTLSVAFGSGWTFALVPGFDADGRVTIANGNQVLTTSVPFDYELNSVYTIRVVATASNGVSFTAVVTIIVTDADEDGPDPTLDFNFMTGVHTGVTLSDIGASAGNVTGMGLYVDSKATEHLFANAKNMSAASWSIFPETVGGNSASTKNALAPTADGFTPITFLSNYGSAYIGASSGRSLAIGEKFVIKTKMKAVDGNTALNARILIDGALTTSVKVSVAAAAGATSAAALGGLGNGITGTVTYDSTDGTHTVILFGTATANAPLRVGLGHSGGGTDTFYGLQAVIGMADKAWRQSATADSVTGFTPALSQAVRNLLQASAYSIAFEINGDGFGMTIPGHLISSGATTGLETNLLRLAGYTHVADASGAIAAAHTSGFAGVSRVVIARDGNDMRVCMNGGKVKTMPVPAVVGAIVKLLNSQTCYLRRLSIWNTKLATNAIIREVSRIDNRVMSGLGSKAMPVPIGTVEFLDDMTEPSVRVHKGTAATYTQASFTDQIARYYDASVATANKKSDGSEKAWIDRYPQHNMPIGGHLQAINGERQLYVTKQFVEESGVDWGGFKPIDFPAAATSGCDGSDYIRITCQLTSNLPAAAQALIPNEQQYSGAPLLSTKWKYVSGCCTSGAGKFEFGKNHRFSARVRYPALVGVWAAFWLYCFGYGQQELDILESIAGTSTRINNALHRDSFAGNISLNLDLPIGVAGDWHNHEAWWEDGRVHFGVSGYYMGSLDCSGATWANFNNSKQYMLLNLALSPGNFGPVPDATTEAAMPFYYDIDCVRVLRTA